MTASTTSRPARAVARLALACARRPRSVVAAWVLLAFTLVAAGVAFGRPTSEETSLPGSDSQVARDLLDAHPVGTGPQAGSTGTLVVRSESGRLDADPARAQVSAVLAALDGVAHVTQARGPSAQAGSLSADGRTGWIAVDLDVTEREVTKAMARDVTGAATAAVDSVDGGTVTVLPGGVLARAADREGGHRSEAIGLVVALLVLAWALRSVVAAALPPLVAVITLAVSVSTIGLLGHVADVPSVATTLATMIGLGVGIDYGLFLLSRLRAELAAGAALLDAVAVAAASSGTAVAWAGSTVVIALGGLAVAGVPVLVTLSWTTAISVVVAVLGALTLLPALMAWCGGRIAPARVRAPRSGRWSWARQADLVTGRPWLGLVASVLVLGALAWPATSLTLAQTDAGDDPAHKASRQAYDALAAAFGPGVNGPLTVVAALDPPASPASASASASTSGGDADPRVASLTAALRDVDGVARLGAPAPSADGAIVRVSVTPTTAPSDPATSALVTTLREVAVDGARVHVGGPVAARADLGGTIADRAPWAIGTVLLLSTALLLVAFGAPVVAAKAALMNLVSIGAAYGVLTWGLQEGHLSRFVGLDGPVPVDSYVPLMLFALLFGLSMDYEVFLLSAVRESWDARGGGPDRSRASVRDGLASTGRVITAAATIMVCVFALFVLRGEPTVTMFGLGMAVAIAVDATIVRGVLVPATMVLLGGANWWTPLSGRGRRGRPRPPAPRSAAPSEPERASSR